MSSLLRLGRKQKNSSNAFWIHIFLFSSYSLGIERINTFIHPCSSLENQPDSRPKWAKSVPVFRPKRPKNPTLWVGTYLYGLHKGVTPREIGRDKIASFIELQRKTVTRGITSHAGVFTGARTSHREEIRAALKTPAWEATRGKDYNREERLCIAWDVYASNRLS